MPQTPRLGMVYTTIYQLFMVIWGGGLLSFCLQYPNDCMVNTENRLKSVVPQVFIFDPYPYVFPDELCGNQKYCIGMGSEWISHENSSKNISGA